MAHPFLQPIPTAWVATGPYGAPNYDEFADCAAVRAAAAARPDSIVAADNPGCFDGPAGSVRRLAAMKAAGRYARSDGLFLYSFGGCLATVGLVATDEISSSAAEPGRLLRNEEVFADKVVERRALVEVTRHLMSPVLLVPDEATEYAALLRALLRASVPATEPLVAETDERGVAHRLWRLDDPAPVVAELARRSFVVADGNHRSLAAQQAGLGWCLAVVADPAGLRIEPYHRVLHLPMTGGELVGRAADLRPTPAARDPRRTQLHVAGRTYDLDLPVAGDAVERLPHTVVERRLLVDALGLDPATVTYVGGDVADDLVAVVDAGGATGAVLMPPVTTAELVAVNAARLQMPRKSTWFVPKARSGLLLAEL